MWKLDQHAAPKLVTNLPGPRATAYLARDLEVVSQSYTRVYPLVVEQASGCVVQDVDGNTFLDCTAGIAVTATGHCHPDVVAAIQQQASQLIHMSGTDFYYPAQIELAEKLASIAPGTTPKKVFFTNSGAESIEAAMKLARYHTGRGNFIAFRRGFHGRTFGAMSLSASKPIHRTGFAPVLPGIYHVDYPTSCPAGGCGDSATLTCDIVGAIEHDLFHRVVSPKEVAAIVIEPVLGEGGYQPLPPGCLPALEQLCREHGILLVVDEVQTGFGRTGTWFASEYSHVEPDIICCAKGIASGLPLGAIIAKAPVMNWPSGSHASTFGGNPVACVAALKTIELLQREYLENCRARGEQLQMGLRKLAENLPTISNVRGLGLMVAFDATNETGGLDSDRRNLLVRKCFEHGLLLLGCGTAGIRFCPPLCITEQQIETALRILAEVLSDW
ncbi:MAG: acetyl ornithine aminotransferase family protein [Zavarzinella sp.]